MSDHLDNWDLSEIEKRPDLIHTLCWMIEQQEISAVHGFQMIMNVVETLNEPYVPIDFNEFTSQLPEEVQRDLWALPNEVLATFANRLLTGESASDLASRMNISIDEVRRHLDEATRAIRGH